MTEQPSASDRDEFREYLTASIAATEQIMRENDDFMLATALGVRRDILRAYDATAADRERERRALAVFEEAQFAMKVLMEEGDGCVLCPLEVECFEPEGIRCLATDFVAAGIRLGILPPEEATNG